MFSCLAFCFSQAAKKIQTEKEKSSVCGKDQYSWNTNILIFSEYAGSVKKTKPKSNIEL
jgi:hypothetical protein